MSSELVQVLRHLLGGTPRVSPLADLDQWWAQHEKASETFFTSVSRAMAAGFAMDCLGHAFASGYQEACAAMVPNLAHTPMSFCVSEDGAVSPSAITTKLSEKDGAYVLEGKKSFVTLGGHAKVLLVVAHTGFDDHERKRLKVLRIPSDREGVSVSTMAPLAFAPELPHAKLVLDHVVVDADELLDGDGYDEYVKPFRTIEDLHVSAAIIGYLVRLGRLSGWGPKVLETLIGFAAAIYPLALVDPMDAAVHVAVGGIQHRLLDFIDNLPWNDVQPSTKKRFERDKRLLSVARGARDERLRVAWRRLRA